MNEGNHKTYFMGIKIGDFISRPGNLCSLQMFLNMIPLRIFFVC